MESLRKISSQENSSASAMSEISNSKLSMNIHLDINGANKDNPFDKNLGNENEK